MKQIIFILAVLFIFQTAQANQKEWTLLLFLNGHNNLDPFGDLNINQMEQFGSTDQVNLVVQWASASRQDTKRIYVTQGTNPNLVESPVIETLPRVDMGDYTKLIEFVLWGMEKYPAKKYFVAVWNHGTGWHHTRLANMSVARGPGTMPDISHDDFTNSKITTQELGYAMNYVAYYTGQKIELYGSDACLMQMIEIANEMKWGVNNVVASQELEPGDGWPYHFFVSRWLQNPYMDGAELGKIITEEYARYYGNQPGITLSVISLQYFDALNQNLTQLKNELLNVSDKRALAYLASGTHSYTYSDYKDLRDFLNRLDASNLIANKSLLHNIQSILNYTILNSVNSSDEQGSHGLSIWLPTYREHYDRHQQSYLDLAFAKETGWAEILPGIVNSF